MFDSLDHGSAVVLHGILAKASQRGSASLCAKFVYANIADFLGVQDIVLASFFRCSVVGVMSESTWYASTG